MTIRDVTVIFSGGILLSCEAIPRALFIAAECLPPLTFCHEYPKLLDDVFSTIRRYDRNFQVGQVRKVRLADGTYKFAQILLKHTKTIDQLDTKFLLKDTNTVSRPMAVHLLNSFYINPISADEKLTVLLLRWVKL